MKWTSCPVGPIQANCYVIEDEGTHEALIVDPGNEIERIRSAVDDRKVVPLAILLTHAHFDHIGALDAARELWKIPAWLHQNEADWLSDPEKNGSVRFPGGEPVVARPADQLLTADQELEIGPFSVRVIETFGHSPGGVSFYFQDSGVVFCGDTLFNGSIGRTDLPGGNGPQLLGSITKKLLSLPADTLVCPGHGFTTTIGREAESNPFLL